MNSSDHIAICALIVSVAALSSIAFAIFTYVDSIKIERKIKDVQDGLIRFVDQEKASLKLLSDSYFEISRRGVEAVLNSYFSVDPAPVGFSLIVGDLHKSLALLDKQHGTFASLKRYLEYIYKRDISLFWDFVSDVSGSSKLSKTEMFELCRIHSELAKAIKS